ncbi:MAG: hypothetical protein P8R54_16795 [Myxococcota bacterium]|nr:hypothetical protein [Myxococcota bacterium]
MSDIMSALSGLLARAQGTPLEDPVFVMGVVGGALLVAGSRLYKLALVAPGLAAGLLLGLEVTSGAGPEIRMIAGLCLGIIGAGVMLLVERLAISLGGAFLVGGLANAVTPLVLPGQDAWYVPIAGAVVGLLIFPKMFRSLLFLLTALGGALCIAWAIGRPQDLPSIGGLWLAGTVIQWLTRPAKGE